MQEYTDERQRPDLTEDEKDLLRKAGASRKLIRVAEFGIAEMERKRNDGKEVYRNSVLEEVKKYLRGTDHIEPQLTEENVESFTQYGGHFFSAIWDGNLYRAFCRADGNNSQILIEEFGLKRINQAKPSHRPQVTG